MKKVGFPLIATVILLALGGLFFGEHPPKAQKVEAADDNNHPEEIFSANSSARNLAQAFAQAGVAYYPEDKVVAFPDPELGLGTVITVNRAMPVSLQDGKRQDLLRTWQDTVGALLKEKNIELGSDDLIAPNLETKLSPNTKITITRVAITNVTEKDAIAFKIFKKDDATLNKGTTKVSRAGVKGQKALHYQVRREDGVEVSRVLTSTEIVKQPEDELQLVGTKPVITVRCKYNDLVLDAAIKNKVDANELCNRMMAESNGNPSSVGAGGKYLGLYQYDPNFWNSVSAKAGYGGASIWDAKNQVYVTAWAWAHGYRGRWP
ncbi:MAG: G5 domain-containing protein [Candidatus Berkelbacteria bacterium]|nr:MAG: G5 domain-containing protein [Candidatus Berkelbacteria bacterium]QQG51572.1 MAG: G5 domain-containing protein [Candidatus Berkelbacteria bacterium]